MPKIQLTPEDMMKGEKHPDGWFKASISSAVAGPNKAQDGINYTIDFAIEGPENRSLPKIFSSKALGFMKPFLAAVAGKTIAQFIEDNKTKGIEFDLEALVTSKLQVKVGQRIYEGREISEITDFAPYNTVVPF